MVVFSFEISRHCNALAGNCTGDRNQTHQLLQKGASRVTIVHCAGLRDISFPWDVRGSLCFLFYWHFEKTKDNKYNNCKDYDGECILQGDQKKLSIVISF